MEIHSPTKSQVFTDYESCIQYLVWGQGFSCDFTLALMALLPNFEMFSRVNA